MICGCAAHRGGLPEPGYLTADAQALNQVLVPFRITAFQVFQQAPPARDHRQQSPAGMMVFAMQLEMILELQDTLAQDSYLDFWRTGIGFVNPVRCNYLLFRIRRQCHSRKDTPRLNLISFVPFKDSTKGGNRNSGARSQKAGLDRASPRAVEAPRVSSTTSAPVPRIMSMASPTDCHSMSASPST
jgi:hypothetical protein